VTGSTDTGYKRAQAGEVLPKETEPSRTFKGPCTCCGSVVTGAELALDTHVSAAA
jgi:hypothetical protein